MVPREDIKAKWAAVKLIAVGQGHFREHARQVGLQALTFVVKIPVLLKVTENSNFPGLFQCGKGQVSLNWTSCAGSELNLLITQDTTVPGKVCVYVCVGTHTKCLTGVRMRSTRR